MKILVLSDLNWEQHLRGVSIKEVESIDMDRVNISRYRSVRRYLDIVIAEKAKLVLIAGDVTGDGSCGHGFHNAFLILLSLLDQLNIPTCFISGNHDQPGYYQAVENGITNFRNVYEISNKAIEVQGLKILGVPYETTYSKSKIKNLLSEFGYQYDIVLAHSQLKRRIRLFELEARYIFTGHYDRKIFGFQDSVFVSLDNDMTDISYATLDLNAEDEVTGIHVLREDNILITLRENRQQLISGKRESNLLINNKPSHDLRLIEQSVDKNLVDESGINLAYLKYLRGNQYQKVLKKMIEVKNNPELKPTLAVTQSIINSQITANYRVSTSLVIDFLGKRTR